MSFLDDVRRQEKERHRESEWFRAVHNLCRFIRQYLRKAEAGSQLIVKPDLLRMDKILLDRLTIFLNGETVVVSPLSLRDSRTPGGGGCILMRSTNGVTWQLLWDGRSTAAPDAWKTMRGEDGRRAGKAESDHLTVVLGDSTPDAETLCEASLDWTLVKLFGLTQRAEVSGGGESEHPRRIARAHTAPLIPEKINGYYHAVNGHSK